MTDREKLIELLNAIDGVCPKDASCYDCEYKDRERCAIPAKADFLIANGVTVQPCKVGDTIYEVDGEHGIVKHEVYEVCVVFKTTATDDNGAKWDDYYTTDDIDTAYKTRDEAKASLPEPPKGE